MRAALAGLLLILPFCAPAHADSHGDCYPFSSPSTGEWELTAGTAAATFYLDDRNYLQGNGLWTYEETNGIWQPKLPGVYSEFLGANLQSDPQRGGSSPYIPNDNETCYDDSVNGPDQLVF